MNNKFLLFICFSFQLLIVQLVPMPRDCTFNIDNCQSQWLYQALPSYHSVQDIKFFDANTGIMIFNSAGMYRTSNGGFNWTPMNDNIYFFDMQKIDSTAVDRVIRTFDRGLTWDSVGFGGTTGGYTGLSFINRDTGWISGANQLAYNCIWKTTNGGITLIQLTDTTGMGKIFFLKYKINGEYYGWHYGSSGDNKFWKTTNSGNNWFQVTRPPPQYIGYFSFIDENTGWITGSSTGGGIYKTTNGGMNWAIQTLHSGNGIHSYIYTFKIIFTSRKLSEVITRRTFFSALNAIYTMTLRNPALQRGGAKNT